MRIYFVCLLVLIFSLEASDQNISPEFVRGLKVGVAILQFYSIGTITLKDLERLPKTDDLLKAADKLVEKQGGVMPTTEEFISNLVNSCLERSEEDNLDLSSPSDVEKLSSLPAVKAVENQKKKWLDINRFRSNDLKFINEFLAKYNEELSKR
ncbi:MAG: hypothetical protein UR26_C0006G0047 [candidate division TM6 bacterium GW2011_GWF2_32_72]|nr:MAG: hypothetical protein UR26_C0006G0047 [candidate division TM6 bacterium GW2011_GWF2_32_72]